MLGREPFGMSDADGLPRPQLLRLGAVALTLALAVGLDLPADEIAPLGYKRMVARDWRVRGCSFLLRAPRRTTVHAAPP